MRKFIISAMLLGVAGVASAQGIRQSVEVTNDYETKFSDFRKSGPDLTIPDSLYRFDYRFDYSQFETPYKGAYEFSPYEIALTPTAMPYDGSRFYLRAGAGYTMHPVLDFVFNPVVKDNFALSIFNTGSGYFGGFHDVTDNFGLSGHYLAKSVSLAFRAGYDGVFAGYDTKVFNHHSGYAGVRLATNAGSFIPLMLDAEYRYNTGQQDFTLKGSVAPGISKVFDLRVDFSYRLAARQGIEPYGNAVSNLLSATPVAQFRFNKASIDGGVIVDYSFVTGPTRKFTLAPFAQANLEIADGAFNFFAGVRGGQYLPLGTEIRSLNHFMAIPANVLLPSRTKIDAHLGFNGMIAKYLHFDVRGGYGIYANTPMAAVGRLRPVDYKAAYAELALAWKSERLVMDATFRYKKSMFDEAYEVFEDAPLSGDFRLTYNWNRRVFAGFSVEGASVRRDISGKSSSLPWFVSPGVYAEYRFNKNVGLWAKGGNLAGMTIYRFPGVAEVNPHFTAGVCLNF